MKRIGNLPVRRAGTAAAMGLAVVLVGACASTPLAPTESLSAAQEAIISAERSDARQFAGAELDEAREKLEQARLAVDAENMTEADLLAQQSRIVAELATARANAAKAEEINRQIRRDAEALKEEMQRTGGQR